MLRRAALVVLAFGLIAPAASAARPKTLAFAKGVIAAFAQDGGRIAWASGEPPGSPCSWRVRVRTLAAGVQTGINANNGPTCRHDVGFQHPGEVSLALAGTRALWTTTESGNFRYVQVYTASLERRRERQLDELIYQYGYDDGDHLGGMAGDGSTLVFGTYRTSVVVEGTCEEDGSCKTMVSGGGVLCIVGVTRTAVVAGASPSALVAASTRRSAIVPAAGGPVEIRNAASGALVASFEAPGKVRAVALGGKTAAVLVQDATGKRIERYDASSGAQLAATAVPGATAPELSLSGERIVFRTGRRIWLLDTAAGALSVVATARSTPLGLSIEGKRVAWAENVRGKGRIRAVVL